MNYPNERTFAAAAQEVLAVPSSSFRRVAFVLGLLLLLTGSLKTDAAFADRPVETYFFTSRWELLAVAEFELFLGSWLLTAVYPRLARGCALMTFLCFLGVSLLTAFRGERSCSCFGELKVSPWVAVSVDSAALLALSLCKPLMDISINTFSPLRRAFLILLAMALLSLPIALAVSGRARSSLLIPSKHVVDLGVLSPGEWRNASLLLTNEGDKAVEIETIGSSCPCLSLECIPGVVRPSEASRLIVNLDLGKEPSFVGKLRIQVQARTRSGALAFSMQVVAKVQDPRFLSQPQGTALAP